MTREGDLILDSDLHLMEPYDLWERYLALDADEEPAVDVVEKLRADYFVVSTDYPHPDGAFPEAMKEFLGLPLDDVARRKILWDNCARLYGIPKLAAPLTRSAGRRARPADGTSALQATVARAK